MPGTKVPECVRLDRMKLWKSIAALHWSQNTLAERAGISRSYLSQLVNERRHASPEIRDKLLAALGGVQVDDLFVAGPSGS